VSLIVMMLVAMFTVHLKYRFSSIKHDRIDSGRARFAHGLRGHPPLYAGLLSADPGRRGALSSTAFSRGKGGLSERPKEHQHAA